VFVTQDEPALGDDSLGGLDRLIAPDQRLFATAERDFDVNWKIFLESFIEGYHIKSTHPESFLPYGFDNLNVIDLFGRNSRVTYPSSASGSSPRCRRPSGGSRAADLRLPPVPNVLITVLSRHTNVVILEPLAVDRTRQFTYTLTNAAATIRTRSPRPSATPSSSATPARSRTAPWCTRSSADWRAAPTSLHLRQVRERDRPLPPDADAALADHA
jgi:hypothetical protein